MEMTKQKRPRGTRGKGRWIRGMTPSSRKDGADASLRREAQEPRNRGLPNRNRRDGVIKEA